jgi:hypothetical protein
MDASCPSPPHDAHRARCPGVCLFSKFKISNKFSQLRSGRTNRYQAKAINEMKNIPAETVINAQPDASRFLP